FHIEAPAELVLFAPAIHVERELIEPAALKALEPVRFAAPLMESRSGRLLSMEYKLERVAPAAGTKPAGAGPGVCCAPTIVEHAKQPRANRGSHGSFKAAFRFIGALLPGKQSWIHLPPLKPGFAQDDGAREPPTSADGHNRGRSGQAPANHY